MANGIYVATSGTVARLQEMEVLAQNLAHANTAGFKRDQVTFESVVADARGQHAIDDDKDFVQSRPATTRLEEGPLTHTGNPLDLAISGHGFLRVETGRGERLTRDGRLMLGRDGALRTITGLPVLDDGGRRIQIPPDTVPEFDEGGGIIAGDLRIGRLGVREVDLAGELDKDEAGLFVPPESRPAPGSLGYTVLQGHVENANVQPVQAMLELIEVQRGFEALHQVIRTYSEMDQRAASLPSG